MRNKFQYDYLLVGAGLSNAVFAYEAMKDGKSCLVVEKRNHVGGNLYCERIENINVHKYGAHIFHTKDKNIWDYMCLFCEFNHYINSPIARYRDEIYNLPFNMNTFYQLWKVLTPEQARMKIDSQRLKKANPENLEEQALLLVGRDIYGKLIKGYTEKQWGRQVTSLPTSIIKRIPLRFRFDNNYFDDPYQGIPKGGYNGIFEKSFAKADVLLNTDFNTNRHLSKKAGIIIHTGMIDEYYDYCYGKLEYRSLYFENEVLNTSNYQGNAVVNYTEYEIPYTRILEHKHFEFGNQEKTVITKEYPQNWEKGKEPYYPVNTDENNRIYRKYYDRALTEKNLYFSGRLGLYSYFDMDRAVSEALKLYNHLNKNRI